MIVYEKGQPAICNLTIHQNTSKTFPLHLVIFRKNSTNIYTCTNNIRHDSLCKGPACVHFQTKHQDTSQTFPLHLVIFRKKSANIYPCTNNIKYDSLFNGPACLHSDETSGHKARLSRYIQLFLGKIVQIYTHVLIILNTIDYAKGQPVCIQTKHQDTSQTFPLHLVIFRKNSTNIYPCTNIKYDSL